MGQLATITISGNKNGLLESRNYFFKKEKDNFLISYFSNFSYPFTLERLSNAVECEYNHNLTNFQIKATERIENKFYILLVCEWFNIEHLAVITLI